MRVYQLAQELGLESKEVLRLAGTFGSAASSALSSLDEETARSIREAVLRERTIAETFLPETGQETPPESEPVGRRDRTPHLVRAVPLIKPKQLEPIARVLPNTDVLGVAVLVLMVFYLIMNRVIPDRFVLPFGASVRVFEVILLFLLGAWVIWTVAKPKAFPTGLLGLSGLLLLVLLLSAPFFHFAGMSLFQENAAERGLLRVILLGGLFMAAYHLGSNLSWARKVLAIVVALTALQAVLAVWELQTATPVFFFDDLARSLGLVDDPLGIRGEFVDVFERLTGEVRAVGTAPHPIVLSAVIALATMVAVGWLISDGVATGRRRWLVLALAALLLGLPATNSRTGFVILAVSLIPLLLLTVRYFARLVPLMGGVVLIMTVAFALSPDTPRLLLNTFTQPDADPNFQVRVERFEVLPKLVSENPFVGAGYLTHDPGIQIFDNAYNLALVETGMIGLLLFVGFFLMILIRCWSAFGRARPLEQPVVFAGVAASLALLIGGVLIDAWTFDQFFPTALVLMGLAAGVTRTIDTRTSRRSDDQRDSMTPARAVQRTTV